MTKPSGGNPPTEKPANIETPTMVPENPEQGTIEDEQPGTITTGGEPNKAAEIAEAAQSNVERLIAESKKRMTDQRAELAAELEQAKVDKAAAQNRINTARKGLERLDRTLRSFEPGPSKSKAADK